MRDASRSQARQNARALLEVAEERGDGEALRLRNELRQLAAQVGHHPLLRAALGGRGVTPADRGRILAAIAESAGASPLLSRLVDVLATRDHLSLVPVMGEVYAELANAANGILPVEATGAVALSAEQEQALLAVLRTATGSEVELSTKVEPEVLGGLRVKMKGRTYDGTVSGRLQALRRSLASGS